MMVAFSCGLESTSRQLDFIAGAMDACATEKRAARVGYQDDQYLVAEAGLLEQHWVGCRCWQRSSETVS